MDEAWGLTGTLLGSADPESRLAGLSVAPLFDGDTAEPAVRPLQDDADPEVAAAATEALEAIARVRRHRPAPAGHRPVAPGARAPRPLTARPGVGQTDGAMTSASRFARRLIL